uniref:Pericentriolar material 1 protein C-terminal domain-containing protein n=1 Tax=Setaria digitata TaxID=48799 RepID=A0A915PZG4_9BILA
MKIATLRKYFLNATPQLLVRFGNILLDLSKGQLVHELDSVLTDLLQNGNDRQLPGDTDEHGNDISDRSREIASIESEPQEAAELIKPIRAESVSQFERGLSRELTPDEASKFEQAKRQLSTGKAKLRKQQTLEKVRNRTEIVADEQHQQMQKQDIERVEDMIQLKKGIISEARYSEKFKILLYLVIFQKQSGLKEGLENDICMIIDGILPRIREHSEVVADDGFMRQLRDELLHQASMVCFPGDAAPTDLFRSQLSTIVDDTLSQYVGAKVGEVREELIFDTSEILYNELAFFQLMCNIDNLAL